ncbi:hypothetical protein HYH03_002848 [Edaphochlamys debaryana]|uniref:Uncharacterized protein n=1 Tax=Edaphochlamys debaryana TaxID=47281 RepID=A0A836C3X3_9CHLO|nr:hypothetical protein HYH03_002848 [Edaphochlamys debaryana]|eukprot:KAG2499270.1 hypothetical protein HYH03_002848 [Edaphochlamys debaryana]
MGDALPFVDLGTGLSATALYSGTSSYSRQPTTCVILAPGGRVKCWGSNGFGQLGQGVGADHMFSTAVGGRPGQMGDNLKPIELGTGLSASALSVSTHVCAVLQPGGRLKCWGNNDNGQLGQGTRAKTIGERPGEMGDALRPVDVGTGLRVEAVAAGSWHTCALLQPGGLVKCWGMNFFGQLGTGDRSPLGVNTGDAPGEMGDALDPVDLGWGVRATAIAAGEMHTCAVLQPGGIVKCWGGMFHMDRVPVARLPAIAL